MSDKPKVYAVNGSSPYEGVLLDSYETPLGRRVVVVRSESYGVQEHSTSDVFDDPMEAIEAAKENVRTAIAANQRRLAALEREGVDGILR